MEMAPSCAVVRSTWLPSRGLQNTVAMHSSSRAIHAVGLRKPRTRSFCTVASCINYYRRRRAPRPSYCLYINGADGFGLFP